MDIGKRITATERNDIVLKSFVWKSVIDIYKNFKNRDITSYLVSVTIKKDTFFIKTNKPLINSELYTIEEHIKTDISQKIKKAGLKWKDFSLKFI